MNPEMPGPDDDRFVDLLSAADEELAAGCPAPLEAAPATLRPRLERGLTVARLLRQALPGWATEPRREGVRLGDYRIVREIGRGGMGVVYEAVQVPLGRRVALKVLSFAAALDPRHLQRFRLEAQAAAQLQHPHIVPVHAVGGESGVHYYAMQLIEGRTLACLIEQTRQAAARGPDYWRTIACLGVQAAEALEYAHQLGVVHRDVKPANLLVDGSGHLWVTDFGLALVQADARLTVSGDVLGTLRYMSPEQALGRRGTAGPEADVYSLGVTLYELLTLRPAFSGEDRDEVLRSLSRDDPRPPRALDPGIPIDLETIVLKAMDREPQARYATAQELADDLKRFLEDRPVQARRPTLVERARRLARRHRSAAWLLVLLLALVTAVSATAVALIARERSKVIAHRRLTLKVIDVVTTELNIRRPGEPPEVTVEPGRETLEVTLKIYGELLQEVEGDPELAGAANLAGRRVAQLQNDIAWRLVHPPAPSREEVDRSVRLARQAVERVPENWAFWNTLGVAHYRAGAMDEAVEALERSLACRLVRPDKRGVIDPYNAFFLAMAHGRRGEQDKARQRYDQGAAWMDNNGYTWEPQLGAFRSEAAAVLGIDWKPRERPGRGKVREGTGGDQE